MHLVIVAGSVLLCLFTFGAADAAVVILTNGDRITGKIVKMQDKKLEIDPDQSSDNLTIDWEDVKSITSDEPMAVKLHGNVEILATIGARVGDRINLYNLEEGGPIRLEDVRSINLSEHDYSGSVSAGGNQTTGNTQTQALNVNGTLTYRTEDHRFVLDGKYNRAQASHQITANNGAFSAKYDYFFTQRFYVGASNLTESDEFQDLTVRNSTALMPGYDLLNSADHRLSIAAGPAVVYQDFTPEPTTVTPSSTWTVRYELKLRDDDVILFHKQQGFKDIGHGSAMRWNGDQGIKVKVIGNWRLNVEYDIRYNSEPAPGKKTTDTNLIVGISYDIKP
jgi:putative salt-induced outer membrane protein YdiY